MLDKKAFRLYTMSLLERLRPGTMFDHQAFEVGFNKMDVKGDGQINIRVIRDLVINDLQERGIFLN